MLGDGAVQRVPLLGTDAAVQGEEGLVVCDCDVAEFDPGQDVEAVGTFAVDLHKDHDQTTNWTGPYLSNDLPLPIEANVAVVPDVAQHPACRLRGQTRDRPPLIFHGILESHAGVNGEDLAFHLRQEAYVSFVLPESRD